MSKTKFSLISLGCFRNTCDSGALIDEYLRRGFLWVERPKDCQLLIINTCGFIDPAKKESISVIEQAVGLKRKGKVKQLVVVGCLVERYLKQLRRHFPEVDSWQGVVKLDPGKMRNKLIPAWLGFLKICEGCLNNCSFCAIPLIKGPLRSKSVKQVIEEVKVLNDQGVSELNIIGQDITAWGKDLDKSKDLAWLLEKIIKAAKQIKWIRLIYTHPRHITDSLIKLVAGAEKICKYLDLPIQHADDKILKLMNRGMGSVATLKLIEKIRRMIPNCFLRSSVIVGFPGEGEKEFKCLLSFLKMVQFERLGAFIYSREAGTAAADFSGQCVHAVKLKRQKLIMRQQSEIAQKVNTKLLGKQLAVLVEAKLESEYLGRSQYDAYEVDGAVYLRKPNLKPGSIVSAKIIGVNGYDLIAE